ncbi:MAG TPA: signal peptidase II [Fibrobacteria bacterium]|nr:signal peptidase II [Fibrobacteria bacterium]
MQRNRIWPLLAIVDGVVLDQATKFEARNLLVPGELHSYLGGSLWVELVRNHGAFLSLGAALSGTLREALLVVGVGIFLVGALWWLLFSTKSTSEGRWTMAAVVAGGMGNLVDRIWFHGGVVDFLNVGIGSLRTGIFNVADMYITAAVVFVLLRSMLRKGVG